MELPSTLISHEPAICRIRQHVLARFDESAGGVYHGPAHWERVCIHAHALAEFLEVDPLVPHLFAWIHDSHRENENHDPEHGHRAAAFLMEERGSLFAFLSDEQVGHLAHACREHTNGLVQAHPVVQACWDADRLDLWRVGIEPNPEFLCTDYAKRWEVIDSARSMLAQSRGPWDRAHQ